MRDYKFKTEPFQHQLERFLKYRDRDYHAHLWEQRTGKSKITIDTAAWQYMKGNITGKLLIAPNGVHLNWVKNEVPTHMPDHIGCEPVAYVSNPNAAERKALDAVLNKPGHGLRFLAMNIEALRSPKGFAFAMQFLNAFRCMLTVDEGSIIKTFDASQTEAVLKLSPHAPVRRLLNGTPVTQGPLDIFPQFVFLDEHILRTTSYYAFRNRYAILETQGQLKRILMGKITGIAERLNSYPWGTPTLSEEKGIITAGVQPLEDERSLEFVVKPNGRMKYTISWKCGARSGSDDVYVKPGEVYTVISGYQRLDELKQLIDPWSDRVLKEDCLDLPPKIYQKRYVELSTKQRKMYDDLKRRSIAECSGRAVTASNALTKMLRLQQIIGGYFVPDQNIPCFDGDLDAFEERLCMAEALPIDEKNHRIANLIADIEEQPGKKAIIWARFKAELKGIAEELRKKYGRNAVVEAHGGIDAEERQANIRRLQTDPECLYLVGNPMAKGVSRGQNMCAAANEYYYSNSFSLEDRLQSEDRPHSPGQTVALGVIDLIAPGTLDEKVVQALRDKKDLADLVTGDKLKEWI